MEELQHQETYSWRRGKFEKTYETILGDYIVKDLMDHINPPSLLDLACGNGYITNQFTNTFDHIVGIDASKEQIEIAKNTYPKIEFVNTLCEDYETDELFTTITAINVLEHVIDPIKFISKTSQHLSSKGVFIFYVPNSLAVNRRISKMMGSLESEYELSPFDINIVGHRRSYDMVSLKRDIENAGLSIKKCGGVFYKMLSSPQMNWLLEQELWDKGGYGWGRVGAEHEKNWRVAFCDACYEYGKEHPEECNLIYCVAQRTF
jgi:2-polyprenyl-3-methyl-5-hydroxy-6-metoxy-1,4-benzoquinol methylase